jgi:hypothetical protein
MPFPNLDGRIHQSPVLPEEVTLDLAIRLIAYEQKISEHWLDKKNDETKNESDNETSEEPVVKRLTKFIKE